MAESATPRVEDLLADQRRRGPGDGSSRVEDYLARYPGLMGDPEGVLDLIYNEVVLREGRGETPTLAEYQSRFPGLAGPLSDLFEVHAAIELDTEHSVGNTTALATPEPVAGVPISTRHHEPPPRARPPASDAPRLDGYEILDVLGRGGMGVVYRARDLRRGVTVAVKTMLRDDAAAVPRFKQEFRALLDLVHPNLSALHQLISDGHSWFIVMEFVDGVDFLRHVRGGAAAGPLGHDGLVRLRRGLRQLARGLDALHRSGKLHRDIKPSNAMVTRPGRVVLMDFGLITTTEGNARDASTEGQVVGTAAYMAPEQAAGRRASAASDWYSLGVMLFEALTGRRPFEGKPLQVLMDKQRVEPPSPAEVAPGVPPDLDALCAELLRLDPAARPSARALLGALGAAGPEAVEDAPDHPSSSGGGQPFVGREAHLATLAEALADAAGGRAAVVLVHGRSGVGKSALVRTFLDGSAERDDAVILSGRCYERESVPYKALDGLVDALARHLRHLPPHEAAALLPRDVVPLARVFPVLRTVDAVVEAPSRVAQVPDPQELRKRAYAALRELLARLGDRAPLILAIDDLQWGDADSLAVLAEILRPPDPPPLLLIATCRSEGDAADPPLRGILGVPGARGLERRELAVGPLPPAEAQDLARRLLGAGVPDADRQAEAVARESGGNPFFVAELARSALTGDASSGSSPGPISLDGVLWSRIRRLPEVERRLLEVVAVAGGPLRPSVAWRCLGRDGDERSALALLRAGRLIRGAGGGPPEGERVEAYHDRIRETVLAHLSPGEMTDRHRRLARSLESEGASDHELLATHLLGAGEPERAGEHSALAAAEAAEALAFERAAAHYRRALDLLPPGRDGRPLRSALAEALANAGRGAEAAAAYLDACPGATVAEALELRRRAAMQFLISGHVDRGLDALRDVLGAIGMELPRTPRRALASLLLRRAILRLRGLGFHRRDPSQIAPADLTRVDVCWSAGVGLSNVDWIRGADFQSCGLLLALRAGEPSRVARAFAVEAAQAATAGVPARRRTARLLEHAETLAGEAGEPYPQGMVLLARGVSSYLEVRWRDALEASDRAEAVFRDRCNGVAWELDTAHAYALWALSHLGEWAELSRRFPVLIGEARERGDLYAVMNLSTYILSIVRLAADDPEGARDGLRRVTGQWSRRGYHVQHNDQVWAEVQVDLYLGDGPAAWGRITSHWPTLMRSLLMRVQFIRVAMWGLRGRCALLGGVAHLREAARAAAKLERERLRWADAQAGMIRAGIARLRDRPDEALRRLDRAATDFRGCEMPLCAASADRRRGELLGGAEGASLVEQSAALMAARGCDLGSMCG